MRQPAFFAINLQPLLVLGLVQKNFVPKSPLESKDVVLQKDKELLKLPICSKKTCPFSDSGKTKFTSISYVTTRNTDKHAPDWSGHQSSYSPTSNM